MSILDRYLSKEFLKFFTISLVVMVGIYLAAESIRETLASNTPFELVFTYYLYMIPEIVVRMVPMSCLTGVLLSLSFINRRNELVIMYASGMSLFRIGYVLLTVVFIIACVSFIVQDRFLPPLSKKRTVFYYKEIKKRADFSTAIKLTKIWYRSKNLIYNIKNLDPKNNVLYGIAIYYFNDKFDLIQYLEAKEALFSGDNYWEMKNGVLAVFERNGTRPMTKRFESKKVMLPETPNDFKEIEKEVDTLRLKELYSFIRRTKDAGIDTKSYEVKFHSRISLSFVPIIMAFLGIPFATRPRRHSSASKDIAVCFLIIFLYWLFYTLGLSMGNGGIISPMLSSWISNLIFMVFGVYITVKEKR